MAAHCAKFGYFDLALEALEMVPKERGTRSQVEAIMISSNPFYAETEDNPQFMDNFRQLPSTVQRIIIGVVLIIVIATIIVLRDMIKTEETTRHDEETLS